MKQNLAEPKALISRLPKSIVLPNGNYSSDSFQNIEIPFRLSGPDKESYRIGKCLLPESNIMRHFELEANLNPKALFPLSRVSQWFYLHIEKGMEVSEPLIMEILPAQKPLAFALFIYLEDGAKLNLIEHWPKHFEGPVGLLHQHSYLCSSARLNHIVVNQARSQGYQYEYRRIQPLKEAKSDFFYFNGQDGHLENEILQQATGEKAFLNSTLISHSIAEQKAEISCRHQYDSPHSEGEIDMKFVAEGRARNRLNGMIEITPNGKGSKGKLVQEVLNLSNTTTIQTIPGLKIDTNDVSAAHSSSVRNINQEDHYYLNSRGLDSEKARKLLISGFLKQSLKKIEEWDYAYKLVQSLI